MAGIDRNANGLEAIGDDELEAAAGGKGFQLCERKQFEFAFPRPACMGCTYLRCWPQLEGRYVFECKFFDAKKERNGNPWGFPVS